MTRQQAHSSNGPSWADVAIAAREVGDANGGTVTFSMGPHHSIRGGMAIEVCLWRSARREQPYAVAVVRRAWPHRGFTTVPSLLYRLILELEAEYERLEARPIMQMETAELPTPPRATGD